MTIRWYQGRLVELLPMLRDRAHSPVLSAVDDSAAAAPAVAAAMAGDRRTAASQVPPTLQVLPTPQVPQASRVPPVHASPGTERSGSADCRRVGRRWRLAWGQRSVLVDDSIGVVHLAVLIANPRREIAAADLVTGLAAVGRGGRAAHPVLDHEAIGEYRNRLKRLEAELDRLAAGDDPDQAARAQAERDWLLAQLTSAAGLGGRAEASGRLQAARPARPGDGGTGWHGMDRG